MSENSGSSLLNDAGVVDSNLSPCTPVSSQITESVRETMGFDNQAPIFKKDGYMFVNRELAVSYVNLLRMALKDMDWRVDEAKVQYDLASMMFIKQLAILNRINTVTGTIEFWEKYRKDLVNLYPTLGAVPSRTLMERMHQNLDKDDIAELFSRINLFSYLRNRLQDNNYEETDLSERDVISADGQSLNATHVLKPKEKDDKKQHRTSGFDVVTVYSFKYDMSLGLRVCNKKNHEADNIELMVSQYPDVFRNSIFTFDALNTREPVIDVIVNDANADYFACLKANQKNTFRGVVEAFKKKAWRKNKKYSIYGSFQTEDATDSNFVVVSNITILPAFVLPTETQIRFKSMKAIVKVVTIKKNLTSGVVSTDVRYFITSLEADQEKLPNIAEEFLKIKLKRWAVETHHFHIDGNFQQDKIRLSNENAIYARTAMNKEILKALLPVVHDMRESGLAETSRFSMAGALLNTSGDIDTAVKVMSNAIGFDLGASLLFGQGFDSCENVETDDEGNKIIRLRYVYGDGQIADMTAVSKDAPKYQNQGVVMGDKRFILRAFNVNGEDESVLDLNEFKRLMEQTSLHSPDNVRKRAYRELKPFEP